MLVRIVLWSLVDAKTSIGELRRYLRDESVDAFESVPGLRFKAWISDESTERWGAVYFFESAEPGGRGAEKQPPRARGLRTTARTPPRPTRSHRRRTARRPRTPSRQRRPRRPRPRAQEPPGRADLSATGLWEREAARRTRSRAARVR